MLLLHSVLLQATSGAAAAHCHMHAANLTAAGATGVPTHSPAAHAHPLPPQVWEGEGVVKAARKIIGATNPLEAEPGTIRGDLAVQVGGVG